MSSFAIARKLWKITQFGRACTASSTAEDLFALRGHASPSEATFLRHFCARGPAIVRLRRHVSASSRGIHLSSASETAERHGWTASTRPDLEYTFLTARRHSGRVRFLRIAVPVFIAFVITLASLTTLFNWLSTTHDLPKITGKMTISGTKITMELPRVSGHTRDGAPYELAARLAEQDLIRPEDIELTDVVGKVVQKDSVLNVRAAGGLYNSKTQRLSLRDDVVLESSGAYVAHLSEARVNMRTGHIVSERPAEVELLNGIVNARHLEDADLAGLGRFGGGVTATFQLQRGGAKGDGGESEHKSLSASSSPSAAALHVPAGDSRRSSADAATMDTGVPNALQGFSRNRERPTKIESVRLEVRDRDRIATFSDRVHLTQGDTSLTCDSLVVHYDKDPSPAPKPEAPSPGTQQHIQQLEAKGRVAVKDKDQTVTANSAIFDAKTNTWTLRGNVVATRGTQIVRGERLVMDVATAVSHMEGGRIRGLFLPDSHQDPRAPRAEAKHPPKFAPPVALEPGRIQEGSQE